MPTHVLLGIAISTKTDVHADVDTGININTHVVTVINEDTGIAVVHTCNYESTVGIDRYEYQHIHT